MHWTYDENWGENDDLCQGDILEPTEALLSLFERIHPYFTNEKYRGFLILTQTCDLALRKNLGSRCSATHIYLSVIRSVGDIIADSLKEHFGYLAPGVYALHKKQSVENLLERIVNQNENKLGLFYLHPDIDAGISVQSLAILRVAISVKASENYNILKEARIGRLSKEFQPKLGWMVGNLYSRVGVHDWKEESTDQNKDFEKELMKDALCFSNEQPIWLDISIFKNIKKDIPNFEELSFSEQEKIIEDYTPEPPQEKALEIIAKIVRNTVPKVKEQHIDLIKNHLRNNEQFASQMRKFQ